MTTAMLHRLRTSAAIAILAGAGVLATALTAAAQSPTPEGTVITNTATANYTDANNNTYTPVTASVSVTVGFKPGIDVAAAAATVTPSSPSTNDTLVFTLSNLGNGPDTMTVGLTNTNTAVVTNIRYVYEGTTYSSLTDLNAALDAVTVPAGGTIIIKVVYDVPVGGGGQTSTVTLTDTSQRSPSTTDSDLTNVTPPLTGTVAVTPDGGQNLQQLPSNGTQYTFTFTVQNNETAADIYNLVASSGSDITIVSVNGVPGTSATLPSLGAGLSTTVNVVYTVNDVAAGSRDTLTLTATSNDPARSSVTDAGFADLTVIRPALTITKEAYMDDKATVIGTNKVIPGQYIWYKMTVTNNGTAAASSVSIHDPLPSQLTWQSNEADAAGWTFSGSGNDVTATLSGTLATGASRFIWVRALVN